MDNFYEIVKQCHKDRIREQEKLRTDINNIAKLEYSSFCAWCLAYKDAQFTEHNFKEYVKSEKILNFWVKKKIAEMYFGYTYNFDYNTNTWNCKKTII